MGGASGWKWKEGGWGDAESFADWWIVRRRGWDFRAKVGGDICRRQKSGASCWSGRGVKVGGAKTGTGGGAAKMVGWGGGASKVGGATALSSSSFSTAKGAGRLEWAGLEVGGA